jgi:hypothetical protein
MLYRILKKIIGTASLFKNIIVYCINKIQYIFQLENKIFIPN